MITGQNLLSVAFPVMLLYIKYEDDNDRTRFVSCYESDDCYKQVTRSQRLYGTSELYSEMYSETNKQRN